MKHDLKMWEEAGFPIEPPPPNTRIQGEHAKSTRKRPGNWAFALWGERANYYSTVQPLICI